MQRLELLSTALTEQKMKPVELFFFQSEEKEIIFAPIENFLFPQILCLELFFSVKRELGSSVVTNLNTLIRLAIGRKFVNDSNLVQKLGKMRNSFVMIKNFTNEKKNRMKVEKNLANVNDICG